MKPSAIAVVQRAAREFAEGRIVLIIDAPDRENEGDLAVAAEFATAEVINFMIRFGRGLVCMPIIGRRLEELGLPLMVPRANKGAAAFTVSVDARRGVSTGVSARDRSTTVQAILDPLTTPDDLVSPGHLFPLRCADGGLMARQGHTEASVELATLAGLYPAAVICEVLNDAGDPASQGELKAFARRYGITVVTVVDLVAYRRDATSEGGHVDALIRAGVD